MPEKYIISVDQSTQGTKALLFDESGVLLKRSDMSHRQIINEKGWVSHDPEEIYQNTVCAVKKLVETSGIDKKKVAGLGISNQRETSLIWKKEDGKALAACSCMAMCEKYGNLQPYRTDTRNGGKNQRTYGAAPFSLFPCL